ncbi:hypothetical protein [Flammeovirga aprica]|uniref:Uncharacterized protein n=1 Tax=Flammeovirga aprica JL-4 TaxID=694437 RepID=A0A7X9P2X7_9BACT|nr:hypothetical protein [Flammeovirga aprica]NME68586.1 hypothetical protein [Flammeovirga aprica JL-4]
MGFFDTRCMISGLSLKLSETVAVFLIQQGDILQPISLPIFGTYNRLGTIDCVEENINTVIVLNFFKSKIASGDIKVDWDEVDFDQVDNIEQLFEIVERGVTQNYASVLFNNMKIGFALIDKFIWNSIITVQHKEEPFPFQGLMLDVYQQYNDLEELSRQFFYLEMFMKENQMSWSLPSDHEQHYDEEISEFLDLAYVKFMNNPVIMNGIESYSKFILEEGNSI